MFLPSRQDVNGIACRTGVIVFFAFCKLARRRAQNMRPARSASYSRVGGGGGALPSNRLMGMCRWMGSRHFHDWIDYDGVAFSTELLEWGRIFLRFWGKNILASSKFCGTKMRVNYSTCSIFISKKCVNPF